MAMPPLCAEGGNVADCYRLTMRVRGRKYHFVAFTNGLVAVRVGNRERSALSPNARPYGVARRLILDLLQNREASHG